MLMASRHVGFGEARVHRNQVSEGVIIGACQGVDLDLYSVSFRYR